MIGVWGYITRVSCDVGVNNTKNSEPVLEVAGEKLSLAEKKQQRAEVARAKSMEQLETGRSRLDSEREEMERTWRDKEEKMERQAPQVQEFIQQLQAQLEELRNQAALRLKALELAHKSGMARRDAEIYVNVWMNIFFRTWTTRLGGRWPVSLGRRACEVSTSYGRTRLT